MGQLKAMFLGPEPDVELFELGPEPDMALFHTPASAFEWILNDSAAAAATNASLLARNNESTALADDSGDTSSSTTLTDTNVLASSNASATLAAGNTTSAAPASSLAAASDEGSNSAAVEIDDLQGAGLTIDDLLVGSATRKRLATSRPRGAPLLLNISLVLTNIFDLDPIAGTVQAQGQTVLQWKDPRVHLPHHPVAADRVQLRNDDVWHPQLDYYNSVDLKQRATRTALMANPSRLVRTERFVGKFAVDMTAGFAFYPGDRHILSLQLELFGNPNSHVAFAPEAAAVRLLPGAAAALGMWSVEAVHERVVPVEKPSTGVTYDRLVAEIHVARSPVSCIQATYLPFLSVLLLAYGSFFIDPRAVPARAAFTAISLLASITLYLGAKRELPPLGYFSLLDCAGLLVTFGSLFAGIAFVTVHWNLRMALHLKSSPPPQPPPQPPSDGSKGKGAERPQQRGVADSAWYEQRAGGIDKLCRDLVFPLYVCLCVGVFVAPFFYALGKGPAFRPQ